MKLLGTLLKVKKIVNCVFNAKKIVKWAVLRNSNVKATLKNVKAKNFLQPWRKFGKN